MSTSKKECIIEFLKSPVKICLLILLIILTYVGIRIGQTNYLFYNLIFVPILGVIVYLLYKEKYYYGLEIIGSVVFIYHIIYILINDMILYDNILMIILSALSHSIAFIILSIIGSGIAHLYHKSVIRTNKLIDRILAIISATGIILILANLIFSLHGNPLIHELAKGSAREYLDREYSDLNLDIHNNYFDTKIDEYVVEVKSHDSIDTYFEIYVDKSGEVTKDTYENVSSKFNTFLRISESYDHDVEKLLLSSNINISNVITSLIIETDSEFEDLKNNLVLDKEYDVSEFSEKYGNISLFVNMEKIDYDNVIDYILNLNEILSSNNIKYNTLNITFTNEYDDVNIFDIKYSDINSAELELIIKNSI